VDRALPKTNLKALVLKKSAELGERITQQQVADATGLSLPTIQRWYKSDVDRIDLSTVAPLLKYLGCSFSELVEYVADDKPSVN
jgi:DNA-binding Xre family transcriptional regulator